MHINNTPTAHKHNDTDYEYDEHTYEHNALQLQLQLDPHAEPFVYTPITKCRINTDNIDTLDNCDLSPILITTPTNMTDRHIIYENRPDNTLIFNFSTDKQKQLTEERL